MLKKTIVITLMLFILVVMTAQTVDRIGSRSEFPQNTRSRVEVINWQETFETGAPGWVFSPNTAANLWHIAPVADAPSPTQAMINQNAQGTYNINMLNYLISPSITLPLSGAIKADFMIKGNFDDSHYPGGTASQLDYWFWDISPNNGTTWYRMSNPYNSGLPNYVFIDAPPEWGFVTESYTGIDGFISDYAGQTVKFRICFKSDGDTPIGTGIMVDNFTIFNDVFLPPPTELSATVVDQNVELNWVAPPSGFSTETITSTNSTWTSYISDAEAYAMKIQNPFTAPLQLHGVKFMLYRMNSAPIVGNPTIHVYANSGGLPGEELCSVPGVTNVPNMDWKLVDITSFNIMIPASGSVFVGISAIDGANDEQGLLADSTSTSADSYALFQGTWDTLANSYTGLMNCGLAGVYWIDDPFAPILTGYKVYHTLSLSNPFVEIATVTDPSATSYIHVDPVAGEINYYAISGVFDTYESEMSNVVSIDLINLLYTELLDDDGVANQSFNVGASNSFANKFTTYPGTILHFAKLYINAIGNSAVIIRVFDDNGAGGLPGTQVLQFTAPISSLTVGWNNLPLPEANLYTDPNGIFYIGVYEYASVSTFALDTDNNGNTWTKTGTAGAWTPYTAGNAMLRALVDNSSEAEDYTEIMPVANLSNAPNPFRQATEISFDMRKAGIANVSIYNLKGQLVRSLFDGTFGKGTQTLNWDGTDNKGSRVAIGVFFCRLTAEGKTLTQKIVRIK
jgi:hypothetical protein